MNRVVVSLLRPATSVCHAIASNPGRLTSKYGSLWEKSFLKARVAREKLPIIDERWGVTGDDSLPRVSQSATSSTEENDKEVAVFSINITRNLTQQRDDSQS